MRLPTSMLTALSLAVGATVAAAPTTTGPVTTAQEGCETTDEDAVLCTSTQWLSCDQALLDRYKSPLFYSVPLAFEAPTGTWAEEGCGYYDEFGEGQSQDTPYDLEITGAVQGNLDRLSFTLFRIAPEPSLVTDEVDVVVRLSIDDRSVFGVEPTDTQGLQPARRRINVTPQPALGGLGESYTVTVTGLDDVLDDLVREGGEEDFHTLRLTVIAYGLPATVATIHQVHAWGGTDAPARVTFNGPVGRHVLDAADDRD